MSTGPAPGEGTPSFCPHQGHARLSNLPVRQRHGVVWFQPFTLKLTMGTQESDLSEPHTLRYDLMALFLEEPGLPQVQTLRSFDEELALPAL